MRKAFILTLNELAKKDERIVLITADLGFMLLESFADQYPDRFFNVGVAEANMIGIATGLAKQGYIPFCYSIATFVSMRGYEQFRNGPIGHNLPVRLIGVGGGFSYGHLGVSHHALEDIAIFRTQPNVSIIAPGNDQQTIDALQKTYTQSNPIYYRLAKDEASVPELKPEFSTVKTSTIMNGKDLLLVTAGGITSNVVETGKALANEGINVTIAVLASITPIPQDLPQLLSKFRYIMTVEDHYVNGGIGSLICETMAENGITASLVRCAVRKSMNGITGSEKYLWSKAGISMENLLAEAQALLGPKK
jgi:transketolase